VGLNWSRSVLRRRRRFNPTLYRRDAVDPPTVIDPAVHRALAGLDIKHRSVIVCRFLLDWSVEETAAALDLRPGTVKSRLSRALDRLRTELQHLDPEVTFDHIDLEERS
jgi:RNA polymerase sigma-70 factor (ECF subfamily)